MVSFVVSFLHWLIPYILQRLHILIKWGIGEWVKETNYNFSNVSIRQGRETNKESVGGCQHPPEDCSSSSGLLAQYSPCNKEEDCGPDSSYFTEP